MSEENFFPGENGEVGEESTPKVSLEKPRQEVRQGIYQEGENPPEPPILPYLLLKITFGLPGRPFPQGRQAQGLRYNQCNG